MWQDYQKSSSVEKYPVYFCEHTIYNMAYRCEPYTIQSTYIPSQKKNKKQSTYIIDFKKVHIQYNLLIHLVIYGLHIRDKYMWIFYCCHGSINFIRNTFWSFMGYIKKTNMCIKSESGTRYYGSIISFFGVQLAH